GRFVFQGNTEGFFSGIPVTAHQGFRQKGCLGKVVPSTQGANDFDGVGRHLDACTNFTELGSAFKQVGFNATLGQRKCGGNAANAAANNADFQFFGHDVILL